MQKDLLQVLAKNIDLVLPADKESLLLVAALYLKTDKSLIPEPFGQQDFEETVEEVEELLVREKGIQKENIARKLSQYFYTTVKGPRPYQLTIYAKELAKLVIDQVNPAIQRIELIHTFRRTLPLKPEDLENAESLHYWEENHFIPSRKIIFSHIEQLQRAVDDQVLRLREIFKEKGANPASVIDSFMEVFGNLAVQTEGIIQALDHKMEVLTILKQAHERFSLKQEEWDLYSKTLFEVSRFFEMVDNRIAGINDKIRIASARLKNLYKTFEYRQQYRLNLEKFMEYILLQFSERKDEAEFPIQIGNCNLPYFSDKFVYIPLIHFADATGIRMKSLSTDREYQEIQREANTNILLMQKTIAKWTDLLLDEITENPEMNLSKRLIEIYAEENCVEVPIMICSNLLASADLNSRIKFEISKIANFLDKNTFLWELKIIHSHF